MLYKLNYQISPSSLSSIPCLNFQIKLKNRLLTSADRDQRRNNIILYNFSEKSEREADRKAFNDMCQVVFSEQFAVSKVIRLGKRSEDKD